MQKKMASREPQQFLVPLRLLYHEGTRNLVSTVPRATVRQHTRVVARVVSLSETGLLYLVVVVLLDE